MRRSCRTPLEELFPQLQPLREATDAVPLSEAVPVVLVRCSTTKIGRTSFTQGYEVFSTAMNARAAVGEGGIVCVDRSSGKPVEVPQDMRAAIERIEGRAPGGA